MPERAAQLASVLTEQARPGPLAHERLLEVLPELSPLLPLGGIRRGATIAVAGAAGVSFALALTARVTTNGGWAAMVGLPSVGLAAAAELGVALERVFFVAAPPTRQWAEVVATAADGAEIVVTEPPASAKAGDVRRVQARVRHRGAVLLLVGRATAWGPELRATVTPLAWEGIGDGHGRLCARRVVVELEGRRMGRPARREFWLPGPDGALAEIDPAPIPLRPLAAG